MKLSTSSNNTATNCPLETFHVPSKGPARAAYPSYSKCRMGVLAQSLIDTHRAFTLSQRPPDIIRGQDSRPRRIHWLDRFLRPTQNFTQQSEQMSGNTPLPYQRRMTLAEEIDDDRIRKRGYSTRPVTLLASRRQSVIGPSIKCYLLPSKCLLRWYTFYLLAAPTTRLDRVCVPRVTYMSRAITSPKERIWWSDAHPPTVCGAQNVSPIH